MISQIENRGFEFPQICVTSAASFKHGGDFSEDAHQKSCWIG